MNFADELKKCTLSSDFIELLSSIKGVLFFIKNVNCQIIGANQLLAEHMGFSSPEELIGKTDFEIFSPELAQNYYNDDLDVLRSGQKKNGIIELFPNYLGDLAWFSTCKIPLFDNSGKIAGLCGILQSYEYSNQLYRPFMEISKGLNFMKENIKGKITNTDLAEACGLTVRQFEIRFKEIFKMSPYKYILKMKILKACEMLITENKTILDVALELGFCDQSAFTFHFKKELSMTPLQYIKRHNRK